MILTLGDSHIYQSHINAVLTQLQSTSSNFPKLEISEKSINSIEDYVYEDLNLINYTPSQQIKAQMIA
jgi:thymidylate synthase